MSHYEIDYSELVGQDKINKALKDSREWLGDKNYHIVVSILKTAGKANHNLLRLGLAMRGIQGYPADAMIDHFVPSN